MKNFGIVVVGAVIFLAIGIHVWTVTKGSGELTQEATSTLQTVKDLGRVIVGIGQEAAPFGYMENRELVGFDVDIARAMVRQLARYAGRELTIEFKPVSDETRIGWVQSGQVHMSLCHTNNTRKRDANIDFTVPYGWDGKGILYKVSRGKGRNLDDFAGKVIGIKRSSSSEGEIQAYFKEKGADGEVGFPNTAYYIPIIYSMTGIAVEKLSDFEEVFVRIKDLLPDFVDDERLWPEARGSSDGLGDRRHHGRNRRGMVARTERADASRGRRRGARVRSGHRIAGE
ncbi:MAG: transporter substrate-binding domain-containing protein [Candidatus Hydrogenedentes bacterium]|nr:transporter substrate-binding domain-containing protein [Candidatus Hydrogenedentota bacterium]